MIVPLVLLAVGATVMGLFGSPFLGHWFQRFVYFGEPEVVPLSAALPGFLVSLGIVVVGAGAAFALYWNADPVVQRAPAWLTMLLQRRYFIDDFYYGVVNRVAQAPTYAFAWFDRNVVDRLVDFSGGAVATGGDFLRRLQTGSVQFYAWLVVVGAGVIVFAFAYALAQGGAK
jgi:NADH-quinone oxidoreductase subunit L